jgi:hypothetical protein
VRLVTNRRAVLISLFGMFFSLLYFGLIVVLFAAEAMPRKFENAAFVSLCLVFALSVVPMWFSAIDHALRKKEYSSVFLLVAFNFVAVYMYALHVSARQETEQPKTG